MPGEKLELSLLTQLPTIAASLLILNNSQNLHNVKTVLLASKPTESLGPLLLIKPPWQHEST